MPTAQLIAVDPEALDLILARLSALEEQVRQARIVPEPQWLTVKEYAAKIGRSERTVLRKVEAGELEAKHMSGVRMIRV